jgi:hypothetical protein
MLSAGKIMLRRGLLRRQSDQKMTVALKGTSELVLLKFRAHLPWDSVALSW